MEKAVNDLGYTPGENGVEPPVIPFRDQQEGWDDWPPVFTPQYMAFQGAVASHTVEFPMRVNNSDYETLPTAELRRRSAINTDIAGAVMRATLTYALGHRTSVIADQIETFRRGAAGEAQRPVSAQTVPGVPGVGPEDVYTTNFPRAYVIPAGKGQRSATAAARLVDHLIANDVRVRRATAGFRLAGRSYPAGSYVVDMHQAKRGIANVILAEGRDISADVSTMYDISGWSLGLLWGASVDKVERADGGLRVPGRTVRAASPTGSVAEVTGGGALRLRLDDPDELAALNSLLGQGVRVRRAADGSAIVPGSARRQAAVLADRHGVAFAATKEKGTGELRRTRVAAAVTPVERFALREMGFEVLPVSTATLNAGFDWSTADVLYVSAGLSVRQSEPGRAHGPGRLPQGRRARGGARFHRGGLQHRRRAAHGRAGRGQRRRQRCSAGDQRRWPDHRRRPGALLRLLSALVHGPRRRGARRPVVRHRRSAGLGPLARGGERYGRPHGRGGQGVGRQRYGGEGRAGGAVRHGTPVP